MIIHDMYKDGSGFVAYFYFDFKDQAKQDSRALLLSLLSQLSDKSDRFYDAFLRLYKKYQNGTEKPNHAALLQCLKNMLSVAGPAPLYLVMDALDECPENVGVPSPRQKVLALVKELVELRLPQLRICITSRPEFDICTALEPLKPHTLSLHDEGGQKQDIFHYVTSVVHSDRKMKSWKDDEKNMVIQKLTQKADGM